MNCNKIIYDKNCNTIVREDNYDSNYVFVYVLQLNQTTGITSQVFIKTSEEQEIIFDLGLDGFYTLVTLKVSKNTDDEYYYMNENFYHRYEKVDLETLLEINPQVSNLDITYEYYFQTCRLRKCFINICYQIFDQTASITCNKLSVDKDLIYKRDLIWSSLNVIKYMIEMDQYEEAERLLEKIMGCNGLCDNGCDKSPKSNNCGCR